MKDKIQVISTEEQLDTCVDMCFASHYENQQELGVNTHRESVKKSFNKCLGLVLTDTEKCGIIRGCVFIDTNYTPWYSNESQFGVMFVYVKPEYRNYSRFSLLIKAVQDLAVTNNKSVVVGAYSGVNTDKVSKLFKSKNFKLIENTFIWCDG